MHVLPLFWFLLAAAPLEQTQVMTTAPNVRLRATPDVNGEIVREEPLASVHTVEARVPGGWVKVDGGYLREELTTPFTGAGRLAVIERIVIAQLARQGAGFEAWNQVLAVVGRHVVPVDDRETQARFALYELKALRGAADAAGGVFRSPFAMRFGETSDVFANHEPAGQWILQRDYIVAVHDEFKDTAAADDILWFAAENGLGGEYLRRYPSGRHAEAAIDAIQAWLTHGTHDPAQAQAYRAGCRDLLTEVRALKEAVARTASPRRASFVKIADTFTAMCR